MDNEKNNVDADVVRSVSEQEITDPPVGTASDIDSSDNEVIGNESETKQKSTDAEDISEAASEKASETETPWYSAPIPKKSRIDGKRLGKAILLLVSFLLLLGAVSTTLYYIFYASRTEFHADCTDTIMWANASVESGHLYDSEFTYACFLPFSTSTLMIPLIKIFGFGMTAHTLGMTGYFILLTLFMILMIREMSGNTAIAFCGTAVFIALTHATKKMREIFWGHTIYYSLGILFLVIGAFMYARMLSLSSREVRRRKEGANIAGIRVHKIMVFLCLCAFVFLTGMDGITGMTLFAIPFVGGIFAEQFLNTKYKLTSFRTVNVVLCVLVFMIMAALGNLFNNELLGDLRSYYTEANSEFSDMSSWIDHCHKLPMAWMKLLGVEDMSDVMFTENEGIANVIKIMTAVVVAVLPVVATLFYKKYGSDMKGRMMRIWVWMHWAVSAVVLMGYICGILSVADWRIVPMLGTSVILSILFVCWAVSEKADIARISVLLIVPVVVAGSINCANVMGMSKDGYKNNDQYMLADFLEEQGVNMGYSTFWNANSITLLTNGKIKVRDVIADKSGVYHRRYQSSNKWYKTDPDQKEYFLLLSKSDFDNFKSSEKYQKEKPVRTETIKIHKVTYVLMIYDHNFVDERNYDF